jgi:SAM-dependent methyltransferase
MATTTRRHPPDRAPDLTAFHGDGQADDPAALIAFLEATGKLPSIRAVKPRCSGSCRLGNAKAALDAGCGFGTDVAEMLGRMPTGGTATGLDSSETMTGGARRRSADLGPADDVRRG